MIYHLYDNSNAGKEGEHDEEHEHDSNKFVSNSLAGHGNDSPDDIQPWINVVLMVITLWIIYPILSYRHKKMVAMIDQHTITPSDFTVEFTKLPKDLDVEHFRDWLQSNSLPNSKCEVAKINLAYDIDDYVAERHRYIYLRNKLGTAPDVPTCCVKSKAQIDDRLVICAAKIDEL
jgi:hypothetical protein